MGRVLAIDYGTKRTGLAVTDPMRIIANSLDTVATHEVLDYLEKYIAREHVDIFVIGLPTQMSGEESETMKQIRPFAEKLQ